MNPQTQIVPLEVIDGVPLADSRVIALATKGHKIHKFLKEDLGFPDEAGAIDVSGASK